MKTLTNVINGTVVGLITAANAFAASGAQEDNNGFYVWVFFAVSAVIILGQLIPAFIVLVGFVKGLGKQVKTEAMSKL